MRKINWRDVEITNRKPRFLFRRGRQSHSTVYAWGYFHDDNWRTFELAHKYAQDIASIMPARFPAPSAEEMMVQIIEMIGKGALEVTMVVDLGIWQ